jgi:protein-S-isoprenylcysteine O-methyltransferase Ste14
MGGLVALLYGVISYATFFASFLYAIVFVGNIGHVPGFPELVIPKTIDSGAAGAPLESALVDAILLSIFAVQHSLMARTGFKRISRPLVPPSVERSTYVLLSSLALALIYWQWQPLPEAVWTVTNPLAVLALTTLFWAGWGIVLVSTFLLNHFELFGLRQVWARMRGETVPEAQFRTPLFYRFVRHPIYLGFMIAFWSSPVMSQGHLLFAVATTGYIFVGIFLEERDLVAHFGETYIVYRERVSMILPLPKRGE